MRWEGEGRGGARGEKIILVVILTQDVLMERLKKLGLHSEFGLFMKSETSRMSDCLHRIHKSLHVSPNKNTCTRSQWHAYHMHTTCTHTHNTV